jgi:hypothetical protein
MSSDQSFWEPLTRSAADIVGVDADLFVALIWVESKFDPDIVSDKGAVGIAQLVPRWHPTVDARDPYASLLYAARLLKAHLNEFGSESLALAAYNAGAGAVYGAGTAIPENGETPQMVQAVLAYRAGLVGAVLPAPIYAPSSGSSPSPVVPPVPVSVPVAVPTPIAAAIGAVISGSKLETIDKRLIVGASVLALFLLLSDD